jgi:hypothetical protein
VVETLTDLPHDLLKRIGKCQSAIHRHCEARPAVWQVADAIHALLASKPPSLGSCLGSGTIEVVTPEESSAANDVIAGEDDVAPCNDDRWGCIWGRMLPISTETDVSWVCIGRPKNAAHRVKAVGSCL